MRGPTLAADISLSPDVIEVMAGRPSALTQIIPPCPTLLITRKTPDFF